MSTTELLLRARIDYLADERDRRLREVPSEALRSKAFDLAAMWLATAENMGVELSDLDAVMSITDAALDAVTHAKFRHDQAMAQR